MEITVETACAHCGDPMTLEIDGDMNVRAHPDDAEPMVFTPDVPLFDVTSPSIIDDF